jgi:hypothetical protein
MRATLMALAVVVLAFEFGIARSPAQRARLLPDVMELEQRIVEPSAEPVVVVFGNSRTLYGVDEREVARKLGLEPTQVLKLALNSGTPSDYGYVYGRHRERLSHASLIVLAVDDWDLARAPLPSTRDLLYGDASRRMAEYDPRSWPLVLIAHGLNTTYAARPYLRNAIRAAGRRARARLGRSSDAGAASAVPRPRGLSGESAPAVEAMWAAGLWEPPSREGHRRQVIRPPALRQPADVVSDRHYCGRLPSACGASQVAELARRVAADGPRVAIARWPLTDGYCDDLEARYPRFVRAFRTAQGALQQLADGNPHVEVRLFGRASAVGLDQRAFYDYGHPSPLGREFITQCVVDWAAGGKAP